MGFGTIKARLLLGAGLIGTVAVLSGGLTVFGMARMGERIEASLAAERRIAGYAVLSTQASSFLVVAVEAIQAGVPLEVRRERLAPVAADLARSFATIRTDLGAAVAEAAALGLNEQSRRATQSLAIARMEALFASTRNGLLTEGADAERLQGFLDVFAQSFDMLLNAAVTEEIRTRDRLNARVEALRRTLTSLAVAVSVLAALMLAVFHFGLVRPQLNRLDLARAASRRIGAEDFAVALPEDGTDEISQLFAETNRMAVALARRKDEVAAEWDRLNETIADRTKALREANDLLARTDQSRRRFFADVGHELRTPLTVILMEAELGAKGAGDPSRAFEVIEARARRLNRRIDDLLRIARSESGQIDLARTPFALNLIVEEALTETEAETRSAGLTVTYDGVQGVLVRGDANWSRQVVVGLIRNAVRHARDGGRLAMCVTSAERYGCVNVTDNGPGIPEPDKTRVFNRFDRGQDTATEGFGIGLALARWVMEEQGGTIALTSPVPDPDRLGDAPGTMMTLRIPLAEE
ncbi:hypothetical protein RGUI_0974 [Rhodovulum sp. P5]|nr:hypothetical protein RGUI_0974 [Rhodovulum sp. P5]